MLYCRGLEVTAGFPHTLSCHAVEALQTWRTVPRLTQRYGTRPPGNAHRRTGLRGAASAGTRLETHHHRPLLFTAPVPDSDDTSRMQAAFTPSSSARLLIASSGRTGGRQR